MLKHRRVGHHDTINNDSSNNNRETKGSIVGPFADDDLLFFFRAREDSLRFRSALQGIDLFHYELSNDELEILLLEVLPCLPGLRELFLKQCCGSTVYKDCYKFHCLEQRFNDNDDETTMTRAAINLESLSLGTGFEHFETDGVCGILRLIPSVFRLLSFNGTNLAGGLNPRIKHALVSNKVKRLAKKKNDNSTAESTTRLPLPVYPLVVESIQAQDKLHPSTQVFRLLTKTPLLGAIVERRTKR